MLRQILVIVIATILLLSLALYGPAFWQQEPEVAGVEILLPE